MRASKLAAAAVFSALFAVAACGGSGTPTSGPGATTPAGQPTAAGGGPTAAPGGPTTKPGGTDTCALLSAADLKSATGADYPAGTVDADGTCTWELTTADSFSSVTVAILPAATLAATKAGIPGGADTTVGGHAAYWGPIDNILTGIWVEIGPDLLYVAVSPSPTDPHGVTKKLAELAVAHM